MEIDAIGQMILSIMPSVVSLIAMIASIAVSISKIKSVVNNSTINAKELERLTKQLLEENKELKKEIRIKIDKVATLDEIKEKSKRGA